MSAFDFFDLPAVTSKPAPVQKKHSVDLDRKPRITGELVTFLNYVFVEIHGGHQAGALAVSRYRGHRSTMIMAEAAGAVKTISSTKYGPKIKQFWVLTDEGKAALAKYRQHRF
ncbi:hypothetical protein [Noviherbaspirillum galbum]|uniref:Uncharacterized protein n=1 Tax=Noviherbaspirillum galbum TaxID=2709383 RepID=A0A6B3SWM0_9BURK|nr:hypothetical protein [Noviherbaspirillum galbum]NEX63376.1 hypothetical protein [Noviherbaspirillum galbum]